MSCLVPGVEVEPVGGPGGAEWEDLETFITQRRCLLSLFIPTISYSFNKGFIFSFTSVIDILEGKLSGLPLIVTLPFVSSITITL